MSSLLQDLRLHRVQAPAVTHFALMNDVHYYAKFQGCQVLNYVSFFSLLVFLFLLGETLEVVVLMV